MKGSYFKYLLNCYGLNAGIVAAGILCVLNMTNEGNHNHTTYDNRRSQSQIETSVQLLT